ncbi:MAG: peptide deformylase [Buchnera aphidicola (Pentalonia nigronervosa)]|uniref:Peptide deformylase n=1 Tax=Buchnera aphidicola (Pentalonia nigronervosa) TaxID=1309793 RepID=A0A7H1AYW7_9GAMM|nr:MAG: peptide deformylase [Buchnera aphidicola (Pentalonia nigronervosa)]
MSHFKILHYPDQRLRIVAKPVKNINKNIKNITKNMIYIMNQENGIGLAATQINVQLQIIVIYATIKQKKNILTLINPQIIKKNGCISVEEGCLSIPEYRAFVPRSNYITVQAINLSGKNVKIEAESITSICIQHEIDHLNGKLFIDYLPTAQQQEIYKKFIKNRLNRNKKIFY